MEVEEGHRGLAMSFDYGKSKIPLTYRDVILYTEKAIQRFEDEDKSCSSHILAISAENPFREEKKLMQGVGHL